MCHNVRRQERGEAVGGTVGYSVRLDTRASAATRLLYCTTGAPLSACQISAPTCPARPARAAASLRACPPTSRAGSYQPVARARPACASSAARARRRAAAPPAGRRRPGGPEPRGRGRGPRALGRHGPAPAPAARRARRAAGRAPARRAHVGHRRRGRVCALLCDWPAGASAARRAPAPARATVLPGPGQTLAAWRVIISMASIVRPLD